MLRTRVFFTDEPNQDWFWGASSVQRASVRSGAPYLPLAYTWPATAVSHSGTRQRAITISSG